MVAEAQGTKPAGREPAAESPAAGRGATARRGEFSQGDDLDWKADDLDRIDRMVAEAQGTKPAGREPAADLPATGRGATAPTGEFSQDDDAFATMDFDALDWKIQRARGHVDTQS